MPTPAVPEPNTTNFCSRIALPVTFNPEYTAAITTAPVPCTSSLNTQ
jgi:hypothetical protein